MPSSSEITRLGARYTARVNQGERVAIRQTIAAYKKAILSVESRIEVLLEQIEDKSATTAKRIALQQQQQIYNHLLTELSQAATQTGSIIDTQRAEVFLNAREYTQVAVASVLRADKLQYPINIGGRANTQATRQMLAQLVTKSPVKNMLLNHSKQGAKQAADTLIQAVTLGENPRKIKPLIRKQLDVQAWQALRIARTEIIRANTAASIATMQETPDITPMYEWSTTGSDACLGCVSLHGETFTLNEEPPRHPNCRCMMLPLVVNPITGSILSEPLESGQDLIDAMDYTTLENQYGRTRARMLRGINTDKVLVADMQKIRRSKEWGDTVSIKPLRELAR